MIKRHVDYSDEFRQVVLDAYPGDQMVITLLDDNNFHLGAFLDDGQSRVEFEFDETNEKRRLAYEMWVNECFGDG